VTEAELAEIRARAKHVATQPTAMATMGDVRDAFSDRRALLGYVDELRNFLAEIVQEAESQSSRK